MASGFYMRSYINSGPKSIFLDIQLATTTGISWHITGKLPGKLPGSLEDFL